jgi:hypothetical protein
MDMQREQWQRTRVALERALDLDVSDRLMFLAELKKNDAIAYEEVAQLLAKCDEDEPTFSGAIATGLELIGAQDDQQYGKRLGDAVGPYELVRILGVGGSGRRRMK